MAFRLPTLTMAVCGALCVPQLDSFAQQSITETSPPIAQVRFGDRSDSANPLRHHAVADGNPAQTSPIGQSTSRTASANLADSMPSAVRRAIYPHLPADREPQKPTVQPVTHLEPANHVESGNHVGLLNQPQPANHRDSANLFEPPQNEMVANLSRLPKPDATSTPLVAAADMQNQTVASLLSTNTKSTDSESTPSTFANKLLDDQSTGESQQQLQALLQNIAGSTCLVIFLGIGFILVAKRVMRGKLTKANQDPAEFRINVVADLRLTPKSNLHLVEVGDQRVLVASDVTGIKSVVSLTKPFAAALDSFDETIPATTSPTTSKTTSQQTNADEKPQKTSQSTAEIEAEMQRKLSEVLGGQAFKDVFYKSTRAVA